MDERTAKLNTLLSWLNEAKHAVFFGGAGVSTDSGLADFRSAKAGLYNEQHAFGSPPEKILSHDFFMEQPTEFFHFYRTKLLNLSAAPNIAHMTLANMERLGLISAVITQNADNLHQRAGSLRVLDLHGNVYNNTCMVCGMSHAAEKIALCEGIPRCNCGGIIKPGIVLFGEIPDAQVVFQCVREINACDLLLVSGTSLRVSSAARLLDRFKGRMVILNDEETAMDWRADFVIHMPIGAAFEYISQNLKSGKDAP